MRNRRSSGSGGKPFVATILDPIRRFLATETSGAALLLGATIVALALANSPWHVGFEEMWTRTLTVGAGPVRVSHDIRHWINDVLMALFFFVVGLEIKRELVSGELSSVRQALLPVIAAVGGMILPAVVFVAVNAGESSARGWGIPWRRTSRSLWERSPCSDAGFRHRSGSFC